MKLKKFNEFISESRVNESATATVDENVFLVDEVVYLVDGLELDIETSYESPDREVGYYGGYSAESWSIYGIESAYKITDPEVVSGIEEIRKESTELQTMGFDLDAQNRIDDLIWNADSVEVTGPELAALEKRIIQLDKEGKLIDLTGTFSDRCDKAVESAMEDYEEDEPDYDDDRYDY